MASCSTESPVFVTTLVSLPNLGPANLSLFTTLGARIPRCTLCPLNEAHASVTAWWLERRSSTTQ